MLIGKTLPCLDNRLQRCVHPHQKKEDMYMMCLDMFFIVHQLVEILAFYLMEIL